MAKTRLEAIREKLKTAKLGGGGFDFWKPKAGENTIRILPGVGDMGEVFWAEIGTHYMKIGPNNYKTWVCPNFTADMLCPICEYVNELYATGQKSDRELAQEIRVSKGWAMNVIDRKDEEKGPQVYSAGVTVMRQIQALIGNDDYGDLIIDPDQGLDLIITRTGTGRQTSYDVNARRKTTPLHEDPDQIDEWLDKAIDLTPVELTDDPEEDADAFRDSNGTLIAMFGIASYERIKREFENAGAEEELEEEEQPEEDTEEDEEDSGAQQVKDLISRRRNASSKRSSGSTTRSPRRRSR